MSPTTTTEGRRRYQSKLREQRADDTRRAVIEAAHDLFAEKGWGATGMRDIATAAGCSVETVYSHFSSKRGVLRAMVDAVAAGDYAPVPIAERPEFQAMGKGSRSSRIRLAAQFATNVFSRTVAVENLLRHVAPTDDEIAELSRTFRERRRLDTEAAFTLIMGRAPTPAERDGFWAIASPETYLLLVEQSGWTDEQYEAWLAETLERLVPRA